MSIEASGFTACEKLLMAIDFLLCIIFFPLTFLRSEVIKQHELGYLFCYGKSKSGSDSLKPGLVFPLWSQYLQTVDMRLREKTSIIYPLAKDYALGDVRVTFFWRVINPWLALHGASDYIDSTVNKIETDILRSFHEFNFHYVNAHDNEFSEEVKKICNPALKTWGCSLEIVVIESFDLPEDVTTALVVKEMRFHEAKREKMISDNNQTISKINAETSKLLLEGGSTAVKLKYLTELDQLKGEDLRIIIKPDIVKAAKKAAMSRNSDSKQNPKIRTREGSPRSPVEVTANTGLVVEDSDASGILEASPRTDANKHDTLRAAHTSLVTRSRIKYMDTNYF